MLFKINPLYKFWDIPAYSSIKNGKPHEFFLLPPELKPHRSENLPKDDDLRAQIVKKHYSDPSNTVDRMFTWALIPDLDYSIGGFNTKMIALWYEPTADKGRRGDRRLMFIGAGYLLMSREA